MSESRILGNLAELWRMYPQLEFSEVLTIIDMETQRGIFFEADGTLERIMEVMICKRGKSLNPRRL